MKNIIVSILVSFISVVSHAQSDYACEIDYTKSKTVEMTGNKQKTFNGINPCISPDGTKLVVTKMDKERNRTLSIIDINSGNETPLTNTLSYYGVWSPDGSKIVFNEFNGEDWQPCVVDPRTKLSVRLRKGYMPTWSDSENVVFHDMYEIFVHNMESPEKSFKLKPDMIFNDSICLSSNTRFWLKPNEYLIFNAGNPKTLDRQGIPREALYYYDMHNTLTVLSPADMDVADFTIKDQAIYFTRNNEGKMTIYSMPLKGGVPVEFTKGSCPSFKQ